MAERERGKRQITENYERQKGKYLAEGSIFWQ